MNTEVKQSYTNGSTNGLKPHTTNRFKISIIRDNSTFRSFEDEWRALAEVVDCYIYQTFDWNRAWWDHFGEGKKLHIITIYEHEELIGILPLFWDNFSLNDRNICRCLRMLGSSVSQPKGANLMGLNPYSDYLDVVIKPGKEEAVSEALTNYFKNQNLNYDEVILDEVPEDSILLDIFLKELKENAIPFEIETSSKCPIIKLEGSWDDYQDSLSKKARYNNNRALRAVDEDSKKGFHVYEAQSLKELHQYFDLLVDLHQDRWNQLGFPGVFAEKRMYDFQREIVDLFFKKGWVQIRTAEPVKDKGSVIAVDLLYNFNKRTYLVHRALDQDSKFSKAGPGNVLLSVAIKEAADSGLNAVDFLRGTESFKFRTANTVAVNKRIIIKNTDKKSRAKAGLVKKYTSAKRRAGIEWYQFRLFLKGKTMKKGIKGYYDFISYRFKQKMSDKKKK